MTNSYNAKVKGAWIYLTTLRLTLNVETQILQKLSHTNHKSRKQQMLRACPKPGLMVRIGDRRGKRLQNPRCIGLMKKTEGTWFMEEPHKAVPGLAH